MWRYGRVVSQNYILTEILVRVILLAIVCVIQFQKPHMHHITDDELRTYYKRPRQDSYVSPWMTIFLIIIVPSAIIFVSLFITKEYAEAVQAFLGWTLALSMNAVITESVKLIVGRPRPDYFYRCYPDGKNAGSRCANDDIDGRKSFPSGHSSFSFCSLGFLSMWLCGKLGVFSRSRGQGLRLITTLVPLFVASVVALSRWCDNHHHWEDIFAGSLIGFTSAYVCYRQYYLPLDSDLSGRPYVLSSDMLLNHQEYTSWSIFNEYRTTSIS